MRYFKWLNSFEKNNCALIKLEGGEIGELADGKPLAKLRPDPYTLTMDEEYRKHVRLTDSLYNDQDAIVASPKLRDFLLAKLGKKLEALPVWIKDHKGRVATKDYSFINILEVQPCLAIEQSQPSYGTISGKSVLLGVEALTIDLKRLSPEAQLFRLKELLRPMLISEDLMNEITAKKFQGIRFFPVKTM